MNIIPPPSRLTRKTIGYCFYYYICLFALLSFLGWLWEVCLYLITTKSFVNRGILTGPWLPIYGAGGLFLYFLLYRLKKHPILVFSLAVIVCCALEYFCSWFLERLWGVRWWDYSGYFANLNGRICLLGAAAFGIGALLAIYMLIPWFEKKYEKIPPCLRKTAAILLLLLFVADAAFSAANPNAGRGITYSDTAAPPYGSPRPPSPDIPQWLKAAPPGYCSKIHIPQLP